MADANPKNREEGMWSNSAVDGVKWQDLMSAIILDRLEASFDNWDDELPHTAGRMTQNTKTDCDGHAQQCTIVEGESSRMPYFDSACHDDDLVHTTTDRDSIACTSLLYDCSTDGFVDGNNSCCRCGMKPQYSLSCLTNNPSSRESISEKIKKNETENIKQHVEIYRNRLECLLKMNYQLQSELKKTIRKNLLMEQYITWPYAVNNGKVDFPGKNDLDQRFDCLFKELEKIRNELKPIQNESYIVSKLEKILHIPLPGCLNTCNKNMNKN